MKINNYKKGRNDMIDLYMHTKYSDGPDSVQELLSNATKANLDTISITDHNTCNAYDMITITHDYSGKGPTISNNSYEIAVAFPSGTKPKVTVTQYADCLKTALYYIDYGGTKDTITKATVATGNLSKSGQSFYLNKGDGYYRIRIKATTKSGQTLTKDNYYAVIGSKSSSTDTTKPSVTVYGKVVEEKTTSTNLPIDRLQVKVIVTENGSGIKRVKYCTSTTTNNCTAFNQTLFSYINNFPTGTALQLTKNVTYMTNYKKVCVQVLDAVGNESDIKCANITGK